MTGNPRGEFFQGLERGAEDCGTVLKLQQESSAAGGGGEDGLGQQRPGFATMPLRTAREGRRTAGEIVQWVEVLASGSFSVWKFGGCRKFAKVDEVF